MGTADELADDVDARLAADDADRLRRYPGSSTARQPVHTVYVPADRFDATIAAEWGAAALASLDEHGPLPTPELVEQVDAVRAKLAREPIEDLRIDFEDGYGVRPDAVEDTDVSRASAACVAAMGNESLPPFVGIRIKSFDPAVRRRGLRTLSLFVSALCEARGIPAGFRITLPKVTSVAQVEAMVQVCESLESGCALPDGTLRFEIQVETSQAILGPGGTALVAPMIHAAAGRCVGLHYGTYDYSASLGISAAEQRLDHSAADHAKSVMQVAAAGTGVPICDGSTNVLPMGDTPVVRSAWTLHAGLVKRSLERGIYQGWDLHPAQLPTRYAATYAFYRSGLTVAAARLLGYLERRETSVAEEPATAQALAGFLLRALNSAAASEAEVMGMTGLRSPDLAALMAVRQA
jgi:citrate lyase beta subunit